MVVAPGFVKQRAYFLRQRWRAMLILMIIAASLAAQLPAIMKVRVAEYDEAVYLDIARNIRFTGMPLRSLGAKGQYDVHAPLYLYILSLYGADSSIAGIFLSRLVTSLFGLGSVLLVFLIGERVAGTLAGFVGAIILAVNPFFALYSFFIRGEVPMVFMILLGLFLLMESERLKSPYLLIGTGLALAVAVLLREFALLFGLSCSLYLLFDRSRDRRLYGVLVGLLVLAALGGWMGWLWSGAPLQFQSLVQRWLNSVAGEASDSRAFVSVGQWGQQIAQDLLGGVISILLAFATVGTLLARKNIPRIRLFFLGYLILAIAASTIVRLKELRHIIEVIPIAALLIATGVNWDLIWEKVQSHWLWKSFGVLAGAAFLFLASPLRLPLRDVAHLSAWFDPLYAWRVFENDRYYNVLRLAGLYLQEHTEPDEVITVVHEATVTAYYANRHYNMLYTAPMERVIQILEQTRYLVWDNVVFLALNEDQIQAVQNYVTQHFVVEQVIQDKYRQVTIYRRQDIR